MTTRKDGNNTVSNEGNKMEVISANESGTRLTSVAVTLSHNLLSSLIERNAVNRSEIFAVSCSSAK
ncbi:MAG: hypothetical protein MJE68_15525 [Proteobacteria bacterium]|nr:hypothetical protein [Pseudomonadota bacterium]